ncbi:hypothetical protein Acsp03_02790 [Actinomadura sp. NBRC 104412]|uniref:hypothetical protein n=1 Tax=Actinomadura sp. NBRC 104412 TaxID=3032203 RepID=UPI0024A31B06|nr:hypothetical protein [Actinomadura sp. NBRC 104412]GLZ02812.1 hypothetical protein Acsp03_02790 [Actinomadura sp. NBRC 104412]
MPATKGESATTDDRMLGPVPGAPALGRGPAQDGGFDCPGCAWPDVPHGLHLDICENGVEPATWKMTGDRAVRHHIPRGCAVGYMPELTVLCGLADSREQSGQPVTGHLIVEVSPSRQDQATAR